MISPIETYFRDLRDIRSSGAAVPETSYYPAFSNLLNEIGKSLKPKVRCIINIRNRGAGIPDGGLFTPDQFQKPGEPEPLAGQLPARGVIEVKPTDDDAWTTADSEQVTKYGKKYGLVLVTNYRDFVLVGRDDSGSPRKLETFHLAENESAFWSSVIHPKKLEGEIGERFAEYLKRMMLHAAPLSAPKDVAWFLASYARDARSRIEGSNLPALLGVRSALEDALGLEFEGEKGDRFFRSTFIQTLFYGVFSAWVLWSKNQPPTSKGQFNWHDAAWHLRVPMIRALYEQLGTPGKLKPLGLEEVMEWTEGVLNRVDRAAFFASFEEGAAVQYFYEPFLEAFDPELRKELGVWYTPPEIVQYMVSRVDTVLREELEIEDGLADPRVYVLDPCAGTGSYLVEVLRRIAKSLEDKGGDALVANDLKVAAMERVFGFEILPAPFVVAHLQMGLLLQNLGAPLAEDGQERVGVYLTNALTGWEPPKEPKTQLAFPELQAESDAASEVKREKPIVVVIGNPPYNAFAGVSPQEEQGLVEPYKENLNRPESEGGWGIKKFNLDDLYIRFFRLAERRIAEMTGQGIVCFISNFSYLGDPSFVVMRSRFLKEFDRLWFDCMNGDSRETGKKTPDGKPDPSVFSTEYNRAGIRVGTAIGLMVIANGAGGDSDVCFRHYWGVTKRTDLLESLKANNFDTQYDVVHPRPDNRFSFRPSKVSPDSDYVTWPRVVDLGKAHYNGPVERRGNSLIVFEQDHGLLDLVKQYLDPSQKDDEITLIAPRFMKSSGEFDAISARNNLKGSVQYNPSHIVRYPFKPFDVRISYLDANIQPLFSRPSPELLTTREIPGNAYFISRDTADKAPEGPPFLLSRLICDYDCISGHARHFPFRIYQKEKKKKEPDQVEIEATKEAAINQAIPNLSPGAHAYLDEIGSDARDADESASSLIWLHALAVGFSPLYLEENADGIRENWPRIPLPASKEGLTLSAEIGGQAASLLDTESSVSGVTSGMIRSELKTIGAVSREGGGKLDLGAGDLEVTARWGYSGKDGATMPGKGRTIQRDYTPEETQAIEDGAKALGLTPEAAFTNLGESTFDIYLNDRAYWKNVPKRVWSYYIGGYQAIKKWLSYREKDLLGRSLTVDEARELMNMARRLAALRLLQPALDENYESVKENAYQWDVH